MPKNVVVPYRWYYLNGKHIVRSMTARRWAICKAAGSIGKKQLPLPPVVYRVKKKDIATVLLLSLFFLSCGRAEAYGDVHNGSPQRYNPRTLGAVDIFRVPFAVPQWDTTKTPVSFDTLDYQSGWTQWYINEEDKRYLSQLKKEVFYYSAVEKTRNQLRRMYGEAFICIGIFYILLGTDKRLRKTEA